MFCEGDLIATMKMMSEVKDSYPLACHMFIVLNHCAHIGFSVDELKFRDKYLALADIQEMGEHVLYHIKSLEPRRRNAYRDNWFC